MESSKGAKKPERDQEDSRYLERDLKVRRDLEIKEIKGTKRSKVDLQST
jgi:hypothetical protein